MSDDFVLARPNAVPHIHRAFIPANWNAISSPLAAALSSPHSSPTADTHALACSGGDVLAQLLDLRAVEPNCRADIVEPVTASHRRALTLAKRCAELRPQPVADASALACADHSKPAVCVRPESLPDGCADAAAIAVGGLVVCIPVGPVLGDLRHGRRTNADGHLGGGLHVVLHGV